MFSKSLANIRSFAFYLAGCWCSWLQTLLSDLGRRLDFAFPYETGNRPGRQRSGVVFPSVATAGHGSSAQTDQRQTSTRDPPRLPNGTLRVSKVTPRVPPKRPLVHETLGTEIHSIVYSGKRTKRRESSGPHNRYRPVSPFRSTTGSYDVFPGPVLSAGFIEDNCPLRGEVVAGNNWKRLVALTRPDRPSKSW